MRNLSKEYRLQPLTDTYTTRFTIDSDRGARLALHRINASAESADSVAGEPVLLAHGTFSNHRTCSALARYLAGRGFDCWLLDYEAHGLSDTVEPAADFETLFLSGTHRALEYVSDTTQRKVHWVGHSGGGLAVLMAIARQPDLLDRLQSLVTLASQASDAGQLPSHRLILRTLKLLTGALGRVPARTLKLGPDNETATVMQQWYNWNLSARWIGTDGIDYTKTLEKLDKLSRLPLLSLAGSGDWFIAPPDACQRLHARLPCSDKTWLECGVQHGYSENFSHARLVSSRASAREIWPRIGDWLTQQKTTPPKNP